MSSLRGWRTAFVVVGLVFAPCFEGVAWARGSGARHGAKPIPRVLVQGEVLLGSPKNFRRLGTVDRDSVFDHIPAIKTIRKEKLNRNSARYRFLLVEANQAFASALAAAAAQERVDLVVEAGGVQAAGIEVIDLTAAIQKLVV